jgi:hypothetical protein
LAHISRLSFVSCFIFFFQCVPREHPSTHLGRGYHGVYFTCLAVILEQWLNISKEIYGSHSPPLVAVSVIHWW